MEARGSGECSLEVGLLPTRANRGYSDCDRCVVIRQNSIWVDAE